jgi:hypothetical protein
MPGKFAWLVILLAVAVSWSFAQEEIPTPEATAETAPDAEVAVEASPPAETPVEAPAAAKLPVAFVAFGDVDESLVTAGRDWTVENLAMPIDVLPAEPRLQLATFDDVIQQATRMMETNRAGVVVLWRPSSDVSNHGAVFPEHRLAVVNLNPMLTPDTESLVIENRVRRQVIRAVCMLFGVGPSPNPLSVMFNYATIEDLDRLGGNLDMPWLLKVQEAATALGVQLIPDSSFNLIQ